MGGPPAAALFDRSTRTSDEGFWALLKPLVESTEKNKLRVKKNVVKKIPLVTVFESVAAGPRRWETYWTLLYGAAPKLWRCQTSCQDDLHLIVNTFLQLHNALQSCKGFFFSRLEEEALCHPSSCTQAERGTAASSRPPLNHRFISVVYIVAWQTRFFTTALWITTWRHFADNNCRRVTSAEARASCF